MKTLYLVIEHFDFDTKCVYADYDLDKCKSYCIDMIEEGEFKKDNWDIIGYDLDDQEVYMIYQGHYR